jgi:hypothetical protein
MIDKRPLKTVQVYCGELCNSDKCESEEINLINYDCNGLEQNVVIGFDKFVNDPETLPSRILDFLYIAAMVFCADRQVNRGERTSLSNDAWARSFEFHIPVLDIDFWENDSLKKALSDALCFMTGDRSYTFLFKKSTEGLLPKKDYEQLSIFNSEAERIGDSGNVDVMLFSGGLDSLAGVIERLNIDLDKRILIVSHRANNTVIHTQRKIIEYLEQKYPNRLIDYGFQCNNCGMVSKEETQRTRMFLFSVIAFSICHSIGKQKFYIYENGITSINLPIQTDVINARASRTTHPKTLGLMNKIFQFFDDSFLIEAPYFNKTKEDIVKKFSDFGENDLIASAVSCSSTRNKPGMAPHCGCCSQCIDRRFAMYAANLDEFDAPYANDFILSDPGKETVQRLYNTLRLACMEEYNSPMELYKKYPEEMTSLLKFWPGKNVEDSLDEIYDLFMRYGDSVLRATSIMRMKNDNLRKKVEKNSFLDMVDNREYLKTPMDIRVAEIDRILKENVSIMFHSDKPKNENDMNDKIKALLGAAGKEFSREFPVIKFGITSYRADLSKESLLVEGKYIRKSTSPSVASGGIAADITEIPDEYGVMFIVYDPDRAIVEDREYINSFESKRKTCYVRIYR